MCATAALVLNSVGHGGLALVRSLGRFGVPVYTMEAEQLTPALFSRYSRGSFRADIRSQTVAASLASLRAAAEKIGGVPVLIPTGDAAAAYLAENSVVLNQWFRFLSNSPEAIARASDKRAMEATAARVGISVPRSAVLGTLNELDVFVAEVGLPILVRGIEGDDFIQCVGKKMFLVRTRAEMLALYQRIAGGTRSGTLLQEYIRGPEEASWIVDGLIAANGDWTAIATGYKVRQCPAYCGTASLGTVKWNAALAHEAVRLVQALGLRGPIDLDFRYDARDGKYKLLDVNPRIGANFRLFTQDGGYDIAQRYYCELTGRPLPPFQVQPGRRYLVEDLDLAASYRYLRSGTLGLPQWLGSLRGIDEWGYWSWSDPVPTFVRLYADARELGRRIVHSSRSQQPRGKRAAEVRNAA